MASCSQGTRGQGPYPRVDEDALLWTGTLRLGFTLASRSQDGDTTALAPQDLEYDAGRTAPLTLKRQAERTWSQRGAHIGHR